jgi:hypothetical protein
LVGLFKAAAVVALLAVPLLVITALPRFFELAASVQTVRGQPPASGPAPAFRLIESTPTNARRFAALDEGPPPTLAPPAATATAAPAQRPTSPGERITIGNTGGVGAVLRADPVTGHPLGALREQQVVEVLERRNVGSSGDWVRVRTADGVEGWVTAIVALPAPATNN